MVNRRDRRAHRENTRQLTQHRRLGSAQLRAYTERAMAKLARVAVAALMLIGSSSRLFADVQLTMQNGRVTVVAKDATLRQILSEWARVGQTKIVNGDRIPGGPLTIELRDVPEEQALKTLLRAI